MRLMPHRPARGADKRNTATLSSATVAVALCALCQLAPALAAENEGTGADHVAILEVAATAEREISERTSHIGPAVAVEIEPIENWLEIEFGASTYRSQGATNWELELPFKKPFWLSETIEIMPGVGPTWAHTTKAGEAPGTWGAGAVFDVFFWRSKRFGCYLEPSYGIAFDSGHQKSASLTAGLFITVP